MSTQSLNTDPVKIYKYPYTDKRSGCTYMISKKYTPRKKSPAKDISKTDIRNLFNDTIKEINESILLENLFELIKEFKSNPN